MRKLTSGEVARHVTEAESSFNDLCDIYHFAGTADSLGEIAYAWDTGTFSVPCGLTVGKEQRDERGQVVMIAADARLRLPDSTVLSVRDKIVAESKTYYVDGLNHGHNVLIVDLVTDDVF